MNENSGDAVDNATVDTGEPIALLRDLEEPATASFAERLGNRIHRRRLGADLGRLGWDGPIAVVVELLSMFFGLFGVGHEEETEEG